MRRGGILERQRPFEGIGRRVPGEVEIGHHYPEVARKQVEHLLHRVELPGPGRILEGVEQAVDLRPDVGTEQPGEVATDERQLEARAELRNPPAEVGEEDAEVRGRDFGELAEVEGGRHGRRKGDRRKRQGERSGIEDVSGRDHQLLERAALAEAAHVERERNCHVEPGPRGREIHGGQPVVGALRGEFAERHPAGGRLHQVERDADVELDLDVRRSQPHHAEPRFDVGEGVGPNMARGPVGPQVVELHEQHLLGREPGGQVDPEVERAGEAGVQFDLDRPEQEPLVGE